MSTGWIKETIANVQVVLCSTLNYWLQFANNKQRRDCTKMFLIYFDKEGRKFQAKTHSNDLEIMCGVNKGTYTKSSIGCGCFDWNDWKVIQPKIFKKNLKDLLVFIISSVDLISRIVECNYQYALTRWHTKSDTIAKFTILFIETCITE